MIDRNDGKDWTAEDLASLNDALENGESIEEAAAYLCRRGSVDDVARKAKAIDAATRLFRVMRSVPNQRHAEID